MTILGFRRLVAGFTVAAAMAAGMTGPAVAHEVRDDVPRIAVISAFAPELAVLESELRDSAAHTENGVKFSTGTLEGRKVVLFLSGISIVNASMTV